MPSTNLTDYLQYVGFALVFSNGPMASLLNEITKSESIIRLPSPDIFKDYDKFAVVYSQRLNAENVRI